MHANPHRWAAYVNDQEVKIIGPQLDGPDRALQFGLGVSRDNPAARVRVVEHTRMADGWDRGIDLGQFRAGEAIDRTEWT